MKHSLLSLDEDKTKARRADEEKFTRKRYETIARMDATNGKTWKIITTNRDLCRTSWSSRLATFPLSQGGKVLALLFPHEFYWLGTHFTFADRIDKTFSLPILQVNVLNVKRERSTLLKTWEFRHYLLCTAKDRQLQIAQLSPYFLERKCPDFVLDKLRDPGLLNIILEYCWPCIDLGSKKMVK